MIPGLGAMGGAQGGLLKVLLPMLMGGGAGGLGGMLGKLTQGGLGGKVNSWVGPDANEDVSEDELESALGRDEIGRIAKEAGVSHDEARTGLASMLPKVVNGLTPSGSIPNPADLGSIAKGLDLKRLLG
jgi:uncharacterized protein YidB (DUF937 family)